VCVAVLFGSPASAVAQGAAAPETWTPISQNAKAITGRVTFSPQEIAFQNGTSLPLTPIGQMLFRSEAKKKVMANLYKTASPADAGPGLCKGKPVAYFVVWRSEQAGRETERGMAPFSGPLLYAGSADDCGHFVYDIGKH
jgi:hypothetical protein